jgi:hypothetical protein
MSSTTGWDIGMSNIHRLSPEPSSSTIEDAEVTTSRLASILVSAVIDNKIDDDGHIYATDGLEFPVWIELDQDRKLLCFFTYYYLDDEVTDLAEDEAVRMVNDLNGSIVLAQFSWKQERLWGHYWMTFDTRVDPRHFIKMLRAFSGAFVGGIKEFNRALANQRTG